MEELQITPSPLSPLDAPAAPVASGGAEMYVPDGVCAKMIQFAVEDGKLAQLSFTGGCEGNLTAISKLVTGMEVSEVVDKLSGITCGNKPTSCTDQLCLALKGYVR